MNTVWVLFEYPIKEDGTEDAQIVGVFPSKESVMAIMRPNEVATPFELGSRLPDGTQEFISGEIQMSPDGEVFERSPPE